VWGLVSALWLAGSVAEAAAPTRLNVIVILVDDLGWTDLGCMGSSFYETPHIDRLAADGVKFTAAYSACTVCSPTRASLLTGKYPARLHLTDWIAGHKRPHARLRIPDWTMHLPGEEPNLAQAFKAAGCATASIGKWHLGGPECYPDQQGFDLNLGGTERGQPPRYLAPYGIATLPEGPPGEFLTDRESQEACAFIERHRDQGFFLYLAHHAVHQPIAGKPAVIEKYRRKVKPGAPHANPTYAALLESVDESVGRLRQKLRDLNLADRTVIIFTSDNGGLLGAARHPVTSNVPLRAGKGSAYEGGVRVPFLLFWPGVTKPASVCDVPVISADVYPTVLEMIGRRPAPNQVVDGESLVPLLRGAGRLKRDSLYWHYPHYHPGGATPYGAIRQGDWRLIEFFEDGRLELYNLKDDLGEQRNLAGALPDKARELQRELAAWRARVGAQMPTANPDFDPARDQPR